MNKCKLGKLLKVKHGFAFKSENYVEKSEYALVTLANISSTNDFQYNEEKTTYYGASFPSEFILKTGDLIMPLTEQVMGLFGNSAFVPYIKDTTFVLNQRVGKVLVDEEKADKFYIHYLLSTDSVRNQLEYRASGTRQRNISPEDVYDVEVFVPDLEEQRRIGKLLYALEQRVYNNNCINDNLAQQVNALYDYWFTQFDFPDENNKPYRSSGGQMVWNDKLKMNIPISFNSIPLRELLSFQSGYSFSSDEYVANGKYSLITIKNVQDDGINLHIDNYIQDIPEKMPHYCLLKQKDILMSLTGNTGRVGLMFTNNCLLNQRVAVVVLNNQVLHAYTYCLLKNNLVRKKLEAIAGGSSQANLSPIDAANIQIAFNEKMAIAFSKKIQPAIDIIVNNLRENLYLHQIRDFLLPLLMNGQATIAE